MSTSVDEEVVVVGGGPAGAAAACLLAGEGHLPLLVERDTIARHKICGEFLSVEARAYLSELNIDPIALGGALIQQVRIASCEEMVEAPLPFDAVGLTRRTLDQALLARAEECGARVVRGRVARTVTPCGAELMLCLRGGEIIRTPTVFLATGKHDLHVPRRPRGTHEDLVGFKTYFALAPAQRAALSRTVEIILFEGGYAGLQPVEGGMANLCLLVQARAFESVEKRWDALLGALCRSSAHLCSRLDGAEALLDKPLSISHVPYGFLHEESHEAEGLFRLGDQMGVIPSFSGDGIAIALHSACLGTAMYCARGNVAGAYHRQMRADIGRQIRIAAFLYDISKSHLARRGLLATFRLFPGILSSLATWTRIPAPRVRAG